MTLDSTSVLPSYYNIATLYSRLLTLGFDQSGVRKLDHYTCLCSLVAFEYNSIHDYMFD
jgi:hypothetical protein